jgi:hypothetical protein
VSPLLTTLTVLGFAALLLLGLQWRFRSLGDRPLHAVLAAAGITLGLLLVLPGVLHTLAVTSVKMNAGKPYDLRFVWLLTTGLILLHAGLVPIGLSGWLRRGERWAIASSASAAVFLLAFLVILNPVAPQFGALIWLVGAWLVALLWALRRPAAAPRNELPA